MSSSEQTAASVAESAPKTEDVPTIRIANSKASADIAGWPPEYVKKMEKDLGVKIELVAVTSDQFDLALASKSANFDIANCTQSRERQVLDAGMAVCLDDYKDYAPNIIKYEDRNNLAREFLSNGTGKLYFKRVQTGPEPAGTECWNGYIVRWDWYKELGYPTINSDDDYLKVLKQMVDAHPTNDAGGPTYGLGQYVGTGLWSWTITKQAQLAYANVVAGQEIDLHDMSVHNMYTDDKATYWQAMEFYNKAYNMGLLDPDFFTMKNDDLDQKVVQGTYAGALRTWDVGNYYLQEAAKDANTLKGYLSVFPEKGGMSAWYGCDPVAGWERNSWFVCSQCANIEKAVAVLDYMDNEDNMRNFYSGVEGTDWKVENGVPVETAEGAALFSKGGDALNAAGLLNSTTGNWLYFLCGKSNISKHSDGGLLNLTYAGNVLSETLNPMQKDYSSHFGVEYPAQYHENQVKKGITIDRADEPKDLYMVLSSTPEDMATLNTQIATLLEGYIPDLVTAPDAAAFEAKKAEAIAACKAAGSDKLYAWADETYQTALKTLDAAKAKYGITK